MDIPTITALSGFAVLVIGAIAGAAVKIIRAVNEDKQVTIAGQRAGAARGRVRDKKIQEIHILTNSRLTAALTLIMTMAKKESDRTGKKEDVDLYEQAKEEVKKAEEATQKILVPDPEDIDLIAAHSAEAKLDFLTKKIV